MEKLNDKNHVNVWLCLILSIVFTVVMVQYSLRHGRLLLLPMYDDVVYFVDGIQELNIFNSQGIIGNIISFANNPPHSPFSTYLASLSFLILGLHDWAPYVGNFIVILVFLLFVDQLIFDFSIQAKAFVFLFILSIPYLSMSVYIFRPDMAHGMALAMGIILALESFLNKNNNYAIISGILFGISLLIKPSVFPFSVFFIIFSLLVSVVLKTWTSKEKPKIKQALLIFGISILTSSPYYLFGFSRIKEYVYQAVVSDANIWNYQADFWTKALVFLFGFAGHRMLGNHVWIFLCLIFLRILFHIFMNIEFANKKTFWDTKNIRLIALVILLISSWLSGTYFMHNEYNGSLFFSFLILISVISLHDLVDFDFFANRTFSKQIQVYLCLFLACIGFVIGRFPEPIGEFNSPEITKMNAIAQEMFTTLNQHYHDNDLVYFLTTGYINPDVFQYLALKQGGNERINYFAFSVSDASHLWKDDFQGADFIVAALPESDEHNLFIDQRFINREQMQEAVRVLKNQSEFEQIFMDYSFYQDKKQEFYLFQRH